MKTDSLGLWKRSPGLQSLAPATRLLLGAILLAGLLLTRPSTLASATWIAVSVAVWLALLRTPIRLLLGMAVWAVVLGSPLFLVAAVFADFNSGLPPPALATGLLQALEILLKGTAVTMAGLTTLSTVDAAQLQEGLTGLRLPRKVSVLITQILVQTGILIEETGSLIRAIRLRTPAGRLGLSWMLARGIPSIWLPRVMGRAERVAWAMTLRGFDGEIRTPEPIPARPLDWIYAVAALLWLAITLTVREARVS